MKTLSGARVIAFAASIIYLGPANLASAGVVAETAQPQTLREFALARNGGSLTWVPGKGVDKSTWSDAISDDAFQVSITGHAIVVDPSLTVDHATAFAPVDQTLNRSSVSTSAAFLLHSAPAASKTIYLDFTGMNVSSTLWALDYSLDASAANFSAYSIDNDGTKFTKEERRHIIDVWSAVAEDFSIFDVDVTTEEPAQDLLVRSNAADDQYGVRALIHLPNPIDNAALPGCSCSGIAYFGTFDSYTVWGSNPPVLIADLPGASGKSTADLVSHEVGHNLGLSHDGYGSDTYYLGRSGWGPIMGDPRGVPLAQWSNGDYRSANQTEDDLSVMQTHGVDLVVDDVGDIRDNAKSILGTSTTRGIISTRTDVDFFSFVARKRAYVIAVASPTFSSNLDAQLEIYDSAGTHIATNNPPFQMPLVGLETQVGLGASVKISTKVGRTYYVSIDGVGQGDPSIEGYSDYGSLGQYVLKIAPIARER